VSVREATTGTPTLVTAGLHFPTSLTFAGGVAYVAESGLPFGGAPAGGRVWRLTASGPEPVVDGLRPPVNGIAVHDGALYLSQAGHPAALTRIDPDGSKADLVTGLPGPGDYHLNGPVVGPDQRLYFSQGAMTNLGIVGLDSLQLAWLQQVPPVHDIPGFDIVLSGVNSQTPDPRTADAPPVRTGAFAGFGQPTRPGQRVAAGIPATAAVLRCALDGSDLQLVAWGVRNAFGLAFLPDGRLLALDQGPDERGSRPVGNAPDLLVEVRAGGWYGWPDFIGDQPVTDPKYRPQRGPEPRFILANHNELPPPQPPLIRFPPHVAATKLDVGPPHAGPWAGQLAIAFFGDEAPMTAPNGAAAAQRGVVRADPSTWSWHAAVTGPWHRPIDVRFHPTRAELWVVDFGQFEMTDTGPHARAGSGSVWRVPLCAAEPSHA
jgi:glucose/arabinose dehydrogenase